MTEFFIKGDDIKRRVCIKFDIDTKISYEEFVKNIEIYTNQSNHQEVKKVLPPILLSSAVQDGMDRINCGVASKICWLFTYDLEEDFNFGLRFFDNIV